MLAPLPDKVQSKLKKIGVKSEINEPVKAAPIENKEPKVVPIPIEEKKEEKTKQDE